MGTPHTSHPTGAAGCGGWGRADGLPPLPTSNVEACEGLRRANDLRAASSRLPGLRRQWGLGEGPGPAVTERRVHGPTAEMTTADSTRPRQRQPLTAGAQGPIAAPRSNGLSAAPSTATSQPSADQYRTRMQSSPDQPRPGGGLAAGCPAGGPARGLAPERGERAPRAGGPGRGPLTPRGS